MKGWEYRVYNLWCSELLYWSSLLSTIPLMPLAQCKYNVAYCTIKASGGAYSYTTISQQNIKSKPYWTAVQVFTACSCDVKPKNSMCDFELHIFEIQFGQGLYYALRPIKNTEHWKCHKALPAVNNQDNCGWDIQEAHEKIVIKQKSFNKNGDVFMLGREASSRRFLWSQWAG